MVVLGVIVLIVGGAVIGTTLRRSSPKVLKPSPVTVPVPGASSKPVSATTRQLMGLVALHGAAAPGFTLVNQSGQPVSLAQLDASSAVVLTFLDDTCRDVCPVVAHEIQAADAALGAQASSVRFVIVDVNPINPTVAAAHQLVVTQGLQNLSNVSVLTGSVATLEGIWAAYHVTVQEQQNGAVLHSDVMDFLSPGGRMRFQATPYADLGRNGIGSLAPATMARWSRGIAHYALASSQG